MKKFILLSCTILLVSVSFAFNPVVNEDVLKSFNETFSNVSQVKWEEYKGYYSASFIKDGIRTQVNYDMKGNMLGSLRYYFPDKLPLNIYNNLKKQYSSKTLYGVTEVTYGNKIVFLVKIEDEKNWLTVKVDSNGNTSVYEKFKKAL